MGSSDGYGDSLKSTESPLPAAPHGTSKPLWGTIEQFLAERDIYDVAAIYASGGELYSQVMPRIVNYLVNERKMLGAYTATAVPTHTLIFKYLGSTKSNVLNRLYFIDNASQRTGTPRVSKVNARYLDSSTALEYLLSSVDLFLKLKQAPDSIDSKKFVILDSLESLVRHNISVRFVDEFLDIWIDTIKAKELLGIVLSSGYPDEALRKTLGAKTVELDITKGIKQYDVGQGDVLSP